MHAELKNRIVALEREVAELKDVLRHVIQDEERKRIVSQYYREYPVSDIAEPATA